MRMKARDVILTAGLLLASCAGAAKPANPLIGNWMVEPGGDVNSEGFSYCSAMPERTFTATTETMYGPGGTHGTDHVIYLISGQDISVSSNQGFEGAPRFTMLGPDEMTLNAVGHCKYRRH